MKKLIALLPLLALPALAQTTLSNTVNTPRAVGVTTNLSIKRR